VGIQHLSGANSQILGLRREFELGRLLHSFVDCGNPSWLTLNRFLLFPFFFRSFVLLDLRERLDCEIGGRVVPVAIVAVDVGLVCVLASVLLSLRTLRACLLEPDGFLAL